jgi:hypothetical protein
MRVFICWSGDFGLLMGQAVEALLNSAFANRSPVEVIPEFSERIEKGTFWMKELEERLRRSDAGIVCLTPENLDSSWMHFETGALALQLAKGGVTDRLPIYPILQEVKPAQITGPLAAYQMTTIARQDILTLLESIAVRAGGQPDKIRDSRDAFERAYIVFEEKLSHRLPVSTVVPKFSALFQRMTFDEPLQQCMSQRWLDRLRGASYARSQVHSMKPLVLSMCEPYHAELFSQLDEALAKYADAMEALLLDRQEYPLGPNNERKIDAETQTACEVRRLAVKAIVGRILDSSDAAPLTPEAVRYFGAETFEERKLIVHRLESKVRTHVDGGQEPTIAWNSRWAYRGSSWDLDRINYYLNHEYRAWISDQSADANSLDCAIHDVVIEMEHVATRGTSAMMPVGYALGALKEQNLEHSDRRGRIVRLLNDVSKQIERDRTNRDPGDRISTLIEEIRIRVGDSLKK